MQSLCNRITIFSLAHPTVRLANSSLSDLQTDWWVQAGGPLLPVFRFSLARCADFPWKDSLTSRMAHRCLIGGSWSTRDVRFTIGIPRDRSKKITVEDWRSISSSCPCCSAQERKVCVGIIQNAGGTTPGSCPSMPISAHLVGYRSSMATGEQWHVWRVDNCG